MDVYYAKGERKTIDEERYGGYFNQVIFRSRVHDCFVLIDIVFFLTSPSTIC